MTPIKWHFGCSSKKVPNRIVIIEALDIYLKIFHLFIWHYVLYYIPPFFLGSCFIMLLLVDCESEEVGERERIHTYSIDKSK